jgi:hypothetical protein
MGLEAQAVAGKMFEHPSYILRVISYIGAVEFCLTVFNIQHVNPVIGIVLRVSKLYDIRSYPKLNTILPGTESLRIAHHHKEVLPS